MDYSKMTFDFDPIVKLVCVNRDCRFNMIINARPGPCDRAMFCVLKHVAIDEDGTCMNMELVQENTG